MKRYFLYLISALLLLCLSCSKSSDDTNGGNGGGNQGGGDTYKGTAIATTTTLYGAVTDSTTGQGIEGVVVSDGYSCVATDANGVYQMKRNVKSQFSFVSTPSEYEITVDNANLPKFYTSISTTQKVAKADFILKKLSGGKQNEFTLFCIADPQCKSEYQRQRYINETMKDIDATSDDYPNVYAITLGDIVWDTPNMWSDMRAAMSKRKVTFFQTIGNHDHLKSESLDYACVKNFERTFGPVDYSFNRGDVHIISMDDVMYKGGGEYDAGITDTQLAWLKQDLSFVAKDKCIVLCCHIPFEGCTGKNDAQVVTLLKQYSSAHIMIGHTHHNRNYIHSSTVYEHVHGAACGCWWVSNFCTCGAPNGYGIYHFKGAKVNKWLYKGTGLAEDEQLRLYDGAQIFGTGTGVDPQMYTSYTFNLASGWIVANVWNKDDKWSVELWQGGQKVADMTRFTSQDWYAVYYHNVKQAHNSTTRTAHMYKAKLPDASAPFEVRATDSQGNTYRADKLTTTY